jgi:hypothetical protein
MKPFVISLISKAALIVAFQAVVLGGSMAQQNDPDLYPNLPMAKEYRHRALVMTEALIEQTPEFAAHKDRILSFIFSRMSINSFERMMTTDYPPLKEGKTFAGPCSPDRQDLSACEDVTRMMAMMVVSHAHDVYMRKILKPDALTTPLFAVSSDPKTDLILSWIVREVSEVEFRKGSKSSFVTQPGDQIFSYISPPFSWQMMFGRAGFAVFRGGTLVENSLGIMN